MCGQHGLAFAAIARRNIQSNHESRQYPASDDEDCRADAFGRGDSQLLAEESSGPGIGYQHQDREPHRGADSGAGGDDTRGDALLAIGYSDSRSDEHGREHDTIANAHSDEARNERGVGRIGRHGESQGHSTACADGERTNERQPETGA